MKRLRYLVRINKDPDSDWGASVPDLPGCVATGKTRAITQRRMRQAIQLHIEALSRQGEEIPRRQPKPERYRSRQT